VSFHILRPKSIRRLILIGFAVVTIPLIVALLNAALSVDKLVRQGQRALFETVRATQSSQRLADSITDMERTARQYLVVGDASLLEVYKEKRATYLEIAERLVSFDLPPLQRERLVRLRAEEKKVHTAMERFPHDSPESGNAVEQYAELSSVANQMLTDNRRLVEREVEDLELSGNRVQKISFLQAAALVPITSILAIFFAFVVARAIRRLDRAIHRLGRGDFSKPVTITGPRDLEQLGERLDWMRLRLLDAENEKTRFLRHISHELKTPLTAVREAAELLGEEVVGSLNNQQREIAAILRDNSVRLQKLIEDLLDFNIASSRMTELRIERLDFDQLIDKVVNNYKMAAMARQLNVVTTLEPVKLDGDEEKLATLVDNLISNAIKYSPEAGQLSISLKSKADRAILEVTDTGPGIPEGEETKVFDAFYQCKSSPISHVQGTGLGLSIAREYVIAHGGHIEAVQQDQQGACLRVTLPLRVKEARVA
jgi:two-component system sensor histidine kinase GlrK